MSFRKNLEHLRKSKKLSQEDLAYKLGVSRQAVSKWEAGAAYPETEKILTLCKLFDCSLDELMKEDIAELKKDQERRYSFNDLVGEITSILKRTFKMIDSMGTKSIIRFLFELFLLFILILVIRIPFERLITLSLNIFNPIGGSVALVSFGLWKFVIEIVYYVTAVIAFVYIYKIRFLDTFDESLLEEDKSNTDIVTETSAKKEIKEVSENKIVKKVQVIKYDFGIFSLIGKMALFFIKCLTFFLAMPIIFLLLLAVAGMVVAIVWLFNGVIFLSIIVFLISFVLFAISLLKVMYNFVVNHRINWQKLFVVLVVSIIGLGIGMGLGALELTKMTVVEKSSSLKPDVVTKEIKMQEGLYLSGIYTQNTSLEYIVDNNLKDNIKIEVSHYKDFTNIIIDSNRPDMLIYSRNSSVSLSKAYKILLTDLKNKEISHYSFLAGYSIKVYASQENIDKMQKTSEDIRQQYYKDQNHLYPIVIQEVE